MKRALLTLGIVCMAVVLVGGVVGLALVLGEWERNFFAPAPTPFDTAVPVSDPALVGCANENPHLTVVHLEKREATLVVYVAVALPDGEDTEQQARNLLGCAQERQDWAVLTVVQVHFKKGERGEVLIVKDWYLSIPRELVVEALGQDAPWDYLLGLLQNGVIDGEDFPRAPRPETPLPGPWTGDVELAFERLIALIESRK